VIQEFPLLVCGKRSDRIENLLFQSYGKPHLPTLSVVLVFSERRRRTLRGPSFKRFLVNSREVMAQSTAPSVGRCLGALSPGFEGWGRCTGSAKTATEFGSYPKHENPRRKGDAGRPRRVSGQNQAQDFVKKLSRTPSTACKEYGATAQVAAQDPCAIVKIGGGAGPYFRPQRRSSFQQGNCRRKEFSSKAHGDMR